MKKLFYLIAIMFLAFTTSCEDEKRQPDKPSPEIPVDPPEEDSTVVEVPVDTIVTPEPEPPKPVITYKEVVETETIKYSSETTNTESKARDGQTGTLKITYKLTLKDGEEVKRQKIKEEIVKQPVSEIRYVKPEPVITYKEITETKSIPFSTSQTSSKDKAQSGYEGVLTITYKLTFKDGTQISKDKLSEKITKQPVSEIKYVEPEPKPEPEPNPEDDKIEIGTIELSIPSGRDNITQYLRDSFDKDSTYYKFPSGEFETFGILPTDDHRTYDWKTQYKNDAGEIVEVDTTYTITLGRHGIVLLQDRSHVFLQGDSTKLYNDEPAVWDGDLDHDGISEPGWVRNGSHMSQRKFFKIRNSKYVGIKGINVESGNLTPVHKPGRPEYDSAYEFEHFVDASNSQYVSLENLYGKGLWGDGIYIRDTDDIYVRDVTIDWNGRQGGAIISGTRAYLENYNVLNSRRSGFDIEGNVDTNDSENFIITYSNFNSHLIGLPMGGPGLVKNVLSINNEYYGATIYSKGNGDNRLRENIMFVNNKARNIGDYTHTKNILVDGIVQDGLGDNSGRIGRFDDCTNITVRNIDMPNYGFRGDGDERMLILLARNTPVSEFKVYDNKQDIGIVTEEKEISLNEVEIGKLYFLKSNEYRTDYGKIDSGRSDRSYMVIPERKPTAFDFEVDEKYETYEAMVAQKDKQRNERNYQVDGKTIYRFIDGEYKELTVEDHGTVYEIFVPEEYIPTEEERTSIPFETNEYMEMQWDRLYRNGKGWKDENYEDDGWRPDWYEDIYSIKKAA